MIQIIIIIIVIIDILLQIIIGPSIAKRGYMKIINIQTKEKKALKGIHLILFLGINSLIIQDKIEVEAKAEVEVIEVGVEVGVGEAAIVEETH